VAESEYNAELETSGRIDISDLTSGDTERLQKLIRNHAKLTGSKRAEAILADWAKYRPMFRKVMPVEYRRALAELEKEQARLQVAAE
jgi:glutamate synthase (NADPH/NADH) large chain